MKSLLIFLFGFPLLLLGQNSLVQYSTLLLPDSLREGAVSVIRSYEEHYTVENDKTARKKVKKVVTLLNDESSENQLTLFYDSDSKITQFEATLYDRMGQKIREVKKSEINDQMAVSGGQFYTDSRVQYVEVENSDYPYTIVFEYEKKLKNFGVIETPDYYPQGYNQSVQHSRLKVEVPEDNELLYDAFDLPDVTEIVAEGRREYTWRVEGLKAKKREPYLPSRSRVLPNVYTTLRRAELISNEKSSFASWEDFGLTMNQLYRGRSTLPETLVSEVEQLVAGATTDREKIDLLYRFMQNRMRYVGVQLGIGGWQPFSAEYVEENRYGDCKALSNYMMSILKVAEIESYPTIIYSGNPSYKVHPDFTTGAGFNHVVLYVPVEDMYLECTSSYLPTGYLGYSTLDRNVVWVTPEGGKMARTPAIVPAEHGHLRSQIISLQEDGTATINLKTRYVGESHEKWRYYQAEVSEKELKEALHYDDEIPDVTGSSFSMSVSEDEPVADLAYETTLPRYARKMGKRFFVPVNKLFAYDGRLPKLEERLQPISMSGGRFLVDSVRIELPEGLSLEAMGEEEVIIEHERGEYRATTSLDGTTLTWIRTLKLKPVKLPAEAYDELRDFYLAVGKAEKKQLVFKAVTRK